MPISKKDFILASQLKKLSSEKGVPIKDLSLNSQVPLKTIYGWLAGSHPRNMIDVKNVALSLGVTMDELAFGPLEKSS